MPPTETQSSFLGRISIRRNQVMEGSHDEEQEDLEHFQKHVADRFSDLLSPPTPPSEHDHSEPTDQIMSIAWLRKLIDVLLCIEAQFKTMLIISRDPSQLSKPPLDRLVPDFLDRLVKALDVCNAIMNGVDSIRHYQDLVQIAVSALEQRPIGDGQVKRAKKALNCLISSMAFEDKDTAAKVAERNRSFGRRGGAGAAAAAALKFRSLSWTMAKGWSASKQVQAMSANLVAPRGNESSGLALPIYITSTVMVFVMWTLTAAIPCQDRSGLTTHFPVPRQMGWAQSMISLQEKIAEEWKKKEKKGTVGLLEEMQKMEKAASGLVEFIDGFSFPVEAEKLEELAAQVAELAEVCRKMKEGLVPLQQQIRELFHRAVRSRTELVDALEQGGKLTTPTT